MSASAPAYVRYTVLALAAVLIVTLAWRGVRWTMHDARDRVRANSPAYAPSSAQAAAERAALWQRDFTEALDIAVQNAGAGNFTAPSPAAGHSESPTLSSGGDESLSAPTSSSPQTAAPSDSPTRQSETRNDPSLSSSSPGTRAAARPRSLSRPTPLRRRSWHQINRMLEMESAKKSVTSDE